MNTENITRVRQLDLNTVLYSGSAYQSQGSSAAGHWINVVNHPGTCSYHPGTCSYHPGTCSCHPGTCSYHPGTCITTREHVVTHSSPASTGDDGRFIKLSIVDHSQPDLSLYFLCDYGGAYTHRMHIWGGGQKNILYWTRYM